MYDDRKYIKHKAKNVLQLLPINILALDNKNIPKNFVPKKNMLPIQLVKTLLPYCIS